MYIVDKWRITNSLPDNNENYPFIVNDELNITIKVPKDKTYDLGYVETEKGWEVIETSKELKIAAILDIVSKKFKSYALTPDYPDIITFILKHKNELLNSGEMNREKDFTISSILEVRRLLFQNLGKLYSDKEEEIKNIIF